MQAAENGGSETHEAGGQEVESLTDALPSEEHDAKEAGLQEEGGQHFEADEGPMTDPAARAKPLKLVPNSNDITIPETTPCEPHGER